MQLFVEELAARHPHERVVLVMDGAGWHDNTLLRWPDNVYPMVLPRYSPELNPTECLWEELRETHFHNRLRDELDALEDDLAAALRALELDRDRVSSITAWPWIVDSLPN
jgi:transposase